MFCSAYLLFLLFKLRNDKNYNFYFDGLDLVTINGQTYSMLVTHLMEGPL